MLVPAIAHHCRPVTPIDSLGEGSIEVTIAIDELESLSMSWSAHLPEDIEDFTVGHP